MLTKEKIIDNKTWVEDNHLVTQFIKSLEKIRGSLQTIIDETIVVDEQTFDNITVVAKLEWQYCATDLHKRPKMHHIVNVLSTLGEKWQPKLSRSRSWS